MKTLDQSLQELLKKGMISRETARERAANPQQF
jgi:twitching motility protein PilT